MLRLDHKMHGVGHFLEMSLSLSRTFLRSEDPRDELEVRFKVLVKVLNGESVALKSANSKARENFYKKIEDSLYRFLLFKSMLIS